MIKKVILFGLFLQVYGSEVYNGKNKISSGSRRSANVFGFPSTTTVSPWRISYPDPMPAGQRLIRPRPEALKSAVHYPIKDPGESVYGNEELIGTRFKDFTRLKYTRYKRNANPYEDIKEFIQPDSSSSNDDVQRYRNLQYDSPNQHKSIPYNNTYSDVRQQPLNSNLFLKRYSYKYPHQYYPSKYEYKWGRYNYPFENNWSQYYEDVEPGYDQFNIKYHQTEGDQSTSQTKPSRLSHENDMYNHERETYYKGRQNNNKIAPIDIARGNIRMEPVKGYENEVKGMGMIFKNAIYHYPGENTEWREIYHNKNGPQPINVKTRRRGISGKRIATTGHDDNSEHGESKGIVLGGIQEHKVSPAGKMTRYVRLVELEKEPSVDFGKKAKSAYRHNLYKLPEDRISKLDPLTFNKKDYLTLKDVEKRSRMFKSANPSTVIRKPKSKDCTEEPQPTSTPKPLKISNYHMNVYPEAPEWVYPSPASPSRDEWRDRDWWYYNQDDYLPFKPDLPRHVLNP